MSSSSTIDTDQLQALLGYQAAGIDGTQIQNVPAMTNGRTDGLNFYVSEAFVILSAVTNLTVKPSVNIGKTGPNFSDIASGLALANLVNAADFITWRPANGAKQVVILPGESLTVRIASGATADLYTATFLVRGFYA